MKIVDDRITSGKDLQQLEKRLRALLTSCRKYNVTLSEKKFSIGTELSFAGHVIGSNGIKQDPAKVQSLSDFPTPTSLTELRGEVRIKCELLSIS